MKRHERVTFRAYQQDQMMLLPPNLEELVPGKHAVRVINEVVEGPKLDAVLMQYKGGGSRSYHPRMMLKVLVYAYTQNMYSSRRIAKGLRENVFFMWLSGQQRPDFRSAPQGSRSTTGTPANVHLRTATRAGSVSMKPKTARHVPSAPKATPTRIPVSFHRRQPKTQTERGYPDLLGQPLPIYILSAAFALTQLPLVLAVVQHLRRARAYAHALRHAAILVRAVDLPRSGAERLEVDPLAVRMP
jgi:hypothetical protein